MLNTLPWFWQARSFLVPLRCWENTPDAGLGDEGEVWSLLRRDVNWKEITAATSPAAHWLFAWSMCPAINSPGEPASLPAMILLLNWNNYQVETPEESSGAPGRVNLVGVKRQTGTGLYKVNTVKREFLNTREPLMYSSLFLSFLCVVSQYTWSWPMQMDETQSLDNPTWSLRPLGQNTMVVVGGPPVCKQARSH